MADAEPDYKGDLPDAEPDVEGFRADCLGAEVVLDTPDGQWFARVVERAKHPDDRKISSPNCNPMFEIRECFMEHPD